MINNNFFFCYKGYLIIIKYFRKRFILLQEIHKTVRGEQANFHDVESGHLQPHNPPTSIIDGWYPNYSWSTLWERVAQHCV